MDSIKLWINFGMAWLAVILAVLLSIVYILRFFSKKESKASLALKKVNAFLRRRHKAMGVVLVIFGLAHGLFSSDSVFTLNIGTICWIASILLGINWLIRNKLSKRKGWMYYHRILTVAFLALIVWHVVDVGGVQAPKVLFGTGNSSMASSSTAGSSTATAAPTTSYHGAQLKDGTYTGEATGYHPGIKVSVVIKDNAIISVEVLDHNEENSRFYSRPIAIVPQEIVDGQTTEVDTVTSGTFTSIGIINAVNDALRQALASGTLPADQSLPANHR
jgi:uncharacterized protein with FMN-binding domain